MMAPWTCSNNYFTVTFIKILADNYRGELLTPEIIVIRRASEGCARLPCEIGANSNSFK